MSPLFDHMKKIINKIKAFFIKNKPQITFKTHSCWATDRAKICADLDKFLNELAPFKFEIVKLEFKAVPLEIQNHYWYFITVKIYE